MADQPQAENNADQDSQQEPMPSSEQQSPEPKQPAEASPQGDSRGEQAGEEPKLPEGVKDRTSKEFDKLKRQLAEEREKRTQYERVLGQQTPQRPLESQAPWYNPETQEVDVNVLQNELNQLKQQNQTLQGTLQRYQQTQDKRQEKVAFKAHPELNPSGDKFNEEFHNAVVGYLANQYAQGNYPSLKKAADTIKKFGSSEVKKAEKEGAKQALEQLSPKEQAALEAEGRSDRRQSVGTLEDLRARTRSGDDDAIRERLKNIPPVGR